MNADARGLAEVGVIFVFIFNGIPMTGLAGVTVEAETVSTAAVVTAGI
ncbi:MAG TPA: hypothetical protein PKN56_03045 [Leptospiraceae bacterium]|nr:hypothetical protein [Leptospiraceae bacterium]HMY65054.1 hypothetical protein [Leptospiraceae bacterium]HNF23348.1 hypothetical protein [Leptospiraceae bacterium]HNM01552.1 hypothetical protein [Leptospiraceae bacterium]HNN02512.1 hypothetical protein [Leptospiraceae bacterium]